MSCLKVRRWPHVPVWPDITARSRSSHGQAHSLSGSRTQHATSTALCKYVCAYSDSFEFALTKVNINTVFRRDCNGRRLRYLSVCCFVEHTQPDSNHIIGADCFLQLILPCTNTHIYRSDHSDRPRVRGRRVVSTASLLLPVGFIRKLIVWLIDYNRTKVYDKWWYLHILDNHVPEYISTDCKPDVRVAPCIQ